MFVIFSVFYILIAATMIVLILLQNGAGADAGSGFGAGASATVFGARGSATFLTRATSVLAALFFILSIAMGIALNGSGNRAQTQAEGLGVMSGVAEKPAAGNAVPTATPAQTGGEVPVAPAAPASPDAARGSAPAAAGTGGGAAPARGAPKAGH
ncbi:MAG: preprotein translocase subunit SecG [Xanthomonadales bacterium]|nr:preprotein translocase subunit SecG [Xanthomonadales bacterium]